MKVQTNLFGEVESHRLTIPQASKIAKVSSATIRNWIKTGYLEQAGKGVVLEESLSHFMLHIAGKDKLNARANKLLKDNHNHNELSSNIDELIQNNKNEQIGIEYENSLSNSYRNREGIYYTPSQVVKDMFRDVEITDEFTFLDPCCGSGNFIIEAIRLGISPEKAYGFDIDENAVLITKERIRREFGYESNNIKVGNFLDEAGKLCQKNIAFDLIFTNPPWGKKIEKADKGKYASIYGTGNSTDSTSLFMASSLRVLKQDGVLAFLVQEAFFNIATFEDIRRKVISKKITRFADYGKVFNGLITKAQSITVVNKEANRNDKIECRVGGKSVSRELGSFLKNPKMIFNFWADEEDAKLIDRLYSVNHITLKDNAKWALGIVTGNNSRFCSNTPKEGYVPIYKGADIAKDGLKEPSTFIVDDFSNLQQVAPLDMYRAKEKIIYKFISSDLCFFCDTEQKYILNSANLFIPNIPGVSCKQIADLLNSSVINWLFKKMFLTHKILRGDLELLPIHLDYYKKYSDFSENDYMEYLQITKTKNGTFRFKE